MADARPALDVFTSAFALTATGLPATWGASSASVIWDAYRPVVDASSEVVEYDTDWASFRRDEVTDIQPGDTFTAARKLGGTPRAYRVDRVDRSDPEFFHVVVD